MPYNDISLSSRGSEDGTNIPFRVRLGYRQNKAGINMNNSTVQATRDEIAKIAQEITDEIIREERWLKNLKGCQRGSFCPRLDTEWINNYNNSIYSDISHGKARLEHFRRVRGYLG